MSPRPRSWPVIAAALVGVPLLYVATFGPALGLAERGYLPVDTVALAYDPCLWLDAQIPEVVRKSILGGARLCGGADALEQARNRLEWRSHPVGDICYRIVDQVHVFEVDNYLINEMMNEAAPRSWEDVGGGGRIQVNTAAQALEILQTRAGQAAAATYLRSLRSMKASLSRGRDLDFRQLFRAIHGGCWIEDRDLRPEVVTIRGPADVPFAMDGQPFFDSREMLAVLKERHRETLRSGVLVEIQCTFWDPRLIETLKEFCHTNNVDLFVTPPLFMNHPSGMTRWAVRASDSIYLDAD